MTWTGTAAAHLATRQPFNLYWFLHARPKTFAGVVDVQNLWTGGMNDDLSDNLIAANGNNAYVWRGVGADGLKIGEINYAAGTDIQPLDVQIYLTTRGEAFVKALDTRIAPAEVWCGIQHPTTLAMLGYKRWWKGYIDSLDIDHAEVGGVSVANIQIATRARFGTLSIAGKKSHESQKRRDPADEIRRYGDLGTKTDDPWGMEQD